METKKRKTLGIISWIFSYKGYSLFWCCFGIYQGLHRDSIGAIVNFLIATFTLNNGHIEDLKIKIKTLEDENQNFKRRFNILWEDYMCRK